MSEVLIVNKTSKDKILQTYKKTQKDLDQDVALIQNWLQTQPHLPEMPKRGIDISDQITLRKFYTITHKTKENVKNFLGEQCLPIYFEARNLSLRSIYSTSSSRNMIEFFLVSNKFSIELTKQKLDMYYSIRGLMPDLFSMINPKLERIKAHMDTSYIFPLPKLVDDMYRIFIIKEHVGLPMSELYAEGVLGKLVNVQEIRLHEDVALANIGLFDCGFLSVNHTFTLTPMIVKMGATILEKVYSNRVKEIHVFNQNSFFNFFFKIAKAIIKPKLMDKIIIHDSLDSVKKYIPLEALPKDYGGELPSLEELQDLWKKKLAEYGKRFDQLDSMRVNERLRPTPLKDLDAFGIQGTFKKLSID